MHNRDDGRVVFESPRQKCPRQVQKELLLRAHGGGKTNNPLPPQESNFQPERTQNLPVQSRMR